LHIAYCMWLFERNRKQIIPMYTFYRSNVNS